MLQAPNETMLVLEPQHHAKWVEFDKSRAGKLTIRVLFHVAPQLDALDISISEGNEAREVALAHVELKESESPASELNVTAGKEVRLVQLRHA